jgi:3-oxoacyl-[acyl-carrier-protein] synthase-3
MSQRIHLSGSAYALGERREIDELPELQADRDLLETFQALGLHSYRRSSSPPAELAAASIGETLRRAALPASEIDVLIYATTSFWQESFYRRQEVSRLLDVTGLTKAYPVGVTLSECANVQTALRVGAAMIAAGEARHVLVVSVDCTAPSASRLVPPRVSVKSDGAASVVLSPESLGGFEYLGTRQRVHAALWDMDPGADKFRYAKEGEAGIKHVVDGVLAGLGVGKEAVSHLVVNNYNLSAMRIAAAAAGIRPDRLHGKSLAQTAHVTAADTLVGLRDLEEAGALAPNALVLLLGSGPNLWGASLVRKLG